MNQPKLITWLAGLGLYLITTGITYATFSYLSNGQTELVDEVIEIPAEEIRSKVDLSAPKTEPCPLNGKLYTEAEKNIWTARRPLAIMVENHLDARPQSGLSKADLVYEAVAEGGITRFMAMYLCAASAEDVQVGPVRSARTYSLDWVSEYGISPLYAHVGGANCDPRSGSGCQNGGKADALGQIRKYGWQGYNDINQFSVGFPIFWRDYDRLGRPVATEHTMYSTTDKLWEVAAQRELTFKDVDDQLWNETYQPWKFGAEENPEPGTIAPAYNFWDNQDSPNYRVEWKYDEVNNQYLRNNGSQAQIDFNNDQQLTAKNIIIPLMVESRANDGYDRNLHILYKNTGSGDALIFKDGQVFEASWNKKSRTERTVFKDEQGKESEFNPGTIWISILPTGKKVDY